jgi:hypothetical protein
MSSLLNYGLIAAGALGLGFIARKAFGKSSSYDTRPNENDPEDSNQSSAGSVASIDLARAKSLTPDWTDDDVEELYNIGKRLRMNPPDLALVLSSESGLKPNAVNKRKSDGFPIAVGLNQLTTAANKSAGITEEERLELMNKPVSYQLPLVENYFKNTSWFQSGKSFDHAGAIYEANFAPGRMFSRGTKVDVILYEKSKDGVFYTQNQQLDTAKKGYITVGDLVEYMRRVSKLPIYAAILTRMRKVMSNNSLAPRLPIA